MSHDTFRWEQESHAITGTFNENGFGSFTSTLAARRREFDQAKATFVQIIFAFLCRALAKMTKRKEKILVKWARVSSNYFLEAH